MRGGLSIYLYIYSFLHIYSFRGLGSGKVVERGTGCYLLLFSHLYILCVYKS